MNTRMTSNVLIMTAAVTWAAYALDVQYPIVSDTYLDSLYPTQNFGAASTVKALVGTGSVARGLFRMPEDLKSLEPPEVHRAVVAFYVFSDLTAGRNVTLYPLTRGFVEGTSNGDGATWNTYDGTNAWSAAGGDYDASFPVVAEKGGDNYFRWDITALLTNSAVRSNLFEHGAILIIDETPAPTSGTPRAPFTSSDSSNPEKPYVQVTLSVHTVFPITRDTYVDNRGSSANANFGLANTVRVLVNSDTSVTRGLFALPSELADYPPEDVLEARVRFYVWQDNTKTRDIVLYPLTRAFVEGSGGAGTNATGATWHTYDGTNLWLTPGGDYDPSNGVMGIKGPVLDTNENDRFFTWDVTALLTNTVTRSNILENGAILIITGEGSPPPSGSDRAPFTSSDDLSYRAGYRPHVEVVLRRWDTRAQWLSLTGNVVQVAIQNPMPHIQHRIERAFNLLSSNAWELVHTLDGSDPNPAWSDPQFSEWTNAYYRIVLEP